LDDDRADAAGSRGHGDDVARVDIHGPDGGKRGAACDVQGAGDLPTQRHGLVDQLVGRHRDVRRLTGSVPREAEDLVADRERLDTLADLGDHPGEVAALPGGEVRWEPVVETALSDRDLAGIDAGRLDGDNHLVLARCRHRDVRDVQHITAAVGVEAHCSCSRTSHRRHLCPLGATTFVAPARSVLDRAGRTY
jgi:hypothetical protein